MSYALNGYKKNDETELPDFGLAAIFYYICIKTGNMLVTAIKQYNGIFIPFENFKESLSQNFTHLILEIEIIEYKNDIIKKTSGLLKNSKIDGLTYERDIREEWK